MPLEQSDTEPLTPYQYPNPPEALPEIVIPHAIPTDERLWVPQAENVWFRPLCLNASQGYWMNLLRVRKSGVLEPPGETHTLYVPPDVEEMITYFQVNGVMYYTDPWGKGMGYEDVFTKIDMCRKHFADVGLGEDYVKQFIR
jgi:hypothetical protein